MKTTKAYLTPEQYAALTPEQKEAYKLEILGPKKDNSKRRMAGFDRREAANQPMTLNDWKVVFMANKMTQNSTWMLGEKNLPSTNTPIVNSICAQFLAGRQLSEKQAYILAKEVTK